MSKKNDNYTIIEIIWIIIRKLVGWGWNLIRWLLFIIVKVLYKILKLYEFERIQSNAYIVKDNLSHTFNFKRSARFKYLYKDIQNELTTYKIYVKADIHNETNDADEVMEDIIENIDQLIVEAELEASKRSFQFASRRKYNLPFVDGDENSLLEFYLDNEMKGYNDSTNSLDSLKG